MQLIWPSKDAKASEARGNEATTKLSVYCVAVFGEKTDQINLRQNSVNDGFGASPGHLRKYAIIGVKCEAHHDHQSNSKSFATRGVFARCWRVVIDPDVVIKPIGLTLR